MQCAEFFALFPREVCQCIVDLAITGNAALQQKQRLPDG
jgi:hypothetical protein